MLLLIGNKKLSSWSLRPWLVMKYFGISFEEKLIPLDQPGTTQQILQYSPSGRVPCLIDDRLAIWDSLAICEYLSEKFPEKKMWPSVREQRAWAHSIACEMHSGFQTMREHLSHDLQRELKTFDWQVAEDDIKRVKKIWSECLEKLGGPFLFGEFTIADAMYAPVVNRFLSYAVPVEKNIEGYVSLVRSLPAHQEWIVAARAETYRTPLHK